MNAQDEKSGNSLIAREKFAVSLRKTKKKEIISQRRQQTLDYLQSRLQQTNGVGDEWKPVLPHFMQTPEQIVSLLNSFDFQGAQTEQILEIVGGLLLISKSHDSESFYVLEQHPLTFLTLINIIQAKPKNRLLSQQQSQILCGSIWALLNLSFTEFTMKKMVELNIHNTLTVLFLEYFLEESSQTLSQ